MFQRLGLNRVTDSAEVESLNNALYRKVLGYIKILPALLALCDALNTLSCLFGYNTAIFSYIGGISILSLAFIYLMSYVLRFCTYHRMFLHYVVFNNIVGCIEYYIGFPVNVDVCLSVFICYTFFFLVITLYLYLHRYDSHCPQASCTDYKRH